MKLRLKEEKPIYITDSTGTMAWRMLSIAICDTAWQRNGDYYENKQQYHTR